MRAPEDPRISALQGGEYVNWTAALLPDDALDPTSLVGRMLKPKATPWQEWPGGECPRCGYHDLEIQNTAEHGWATDGDPIRCCRCGLVGWMNVDAEDACDEMFPEDYEDLPDDWEAPPATVEPLPLWRVMGAAFDDSDWTDRHGAAAEIEALRDWLPDMPPQELLRQWCHEYGDMDYTKVRRTMDWLRALLTKQAGIARGGPDG